MAKHTKHDEAPGGLARLDDLDDYEVADGEPDVRGWSVKTTDGRKIGEVDSLIVDTGAMKVCYLGVDLDRKALALDEDRTVLVPIGDARLDDDHDDVLLGAATVEQIVLLPTYRRGTPIAAQETRTPDERETRGFYGKRGGTGDVQRLTLSEEELRVGKRQVEAGAVNVHKTVETQHVTERVPVMHEEVTVERRPVSADATDADGISEGEIRIPLMAEEAVVAKRAVAKEEVVIRKQAVQDEQTVEADLRRERVDVDRDATDRPAR